MAVDLTPLEEFNKKVREQNKTLDTNIKSLRTPFRQLVGEIKTVNAEFAKIASENIGQTQDTWKGLITQAKKQRITTEILTTEFENASKQVESSAKKQAKLEDQIYNAKKEEEQKRRDAIKADRENAAAGFGSLNRLEKEKADLDKDYLSAGKARRAEINQELTVLATNISEREAFLTKASKDREEKLVEEKEESIRLEVEGRRENEKLVEETNAEYERQLDEASKTESFDKFTGSIKTLTGGLVDIEGVLDPVAKYVGAFRDLGSVIGSPLAGVKNSFNEFKGMLKASSEQGEESSEALKESNESVAEMVADSSKKTTGGFGKLIKNIGLTGVALALLAAGIIALMNRFESFDRFIKGLLGFEDTPDQTKTEFDNLSDADKTGEAGQELIDQQEDRVESLEYKEDVLDKASEQAGVVSSSVKGMSKAALNTPTATRGITGAFKEGVDLAGDATRLNSAGQRIGADGKFVKDATKTQKILNVGKEVTKTAAVNTTGSVFKKVASKAGAPVAVLLTGVEVMRKLQESDDMAATLQEMRDNQEITEEDYQKGLLLVEEKKKEDVVRPISSTAAGVVASSAAAVKAAPLLAAGPLGWIAYGAIVLGSGIIASTVVDKGVDHIMDADDELNEMLGDNSFDPGDAKEDLNEMKQDVVDIQNRTGDALKKGYGDVALSAEDAASRIAIQVQKNDSVSSTLSVADTSAQNQDSSAQAALATP